MIDLKQYGYEEHANGHSKEYSKEHSKEYAKEYSIETQTTPLTPGRITEHQREKYTVITPYGEVAASLKGSFHHSAKMRVDFPCVGDFVLLQYNPTGDSRIAELLPRKSKFSRADFSGHAAGYAKTIHEQVVAANFDYVFILSSLNADFKVSRIQRYITQARQGGGQPVVILTKADLVEGYQDDDNLNQVEELFQVEQQHQSSEPYKGDRPHQTFEPYSSHIAAVKRVAPDIPVHSVSSHTGQGLDSLSEYLKPTKTIVFLGMSGVGKSSLLNALINETVMAVSAIREDDARGRHTTTHRQLFMLPSGAMIIDTPGMRELGLFDADEGISQTFADIEDLFTKCRFSDCGHDSEPGCAVRAAIASGALSQDRWREYQSQMRENRFVEDKAAFMREKRDAYKSIALYSRSMKKKR